MYSRFNEVPLLDNESLNRFEMPLEGKTAFIDYRKTAGSIRLLHTEVPKELQGKGIGSVLIEKTFRFIEAASSKMEPICPFITAFLQKHPEWNRIREPRISGK